MVVEGYAIRFNEPAVIPVGDLEYREIILPEALQGADMSDVPMKAFDHKVVVARTRNKTLELIPDEQGLFVRARLANTTAGRDLHELVRRGDMAGMSFAFTVRNGGSRFDPVTRTRTISGFRKIWDVTAAGEPAYPSTTISARSYFEAEAEEMRKALERAELRRRLILKTYL